MNRRKSKKRKNKPAEQKESNPVPIPQHKGWPVSSVRMLALVALAIVVFGIYVHSARFGFIYDDHKLIVRQGRADTLEDFTRVFKERHWDNLAYYRPVSRITMVVQKWLHGDNAGPFHLFNAILIGFTAVAATCLLSQKPFRIPFALSIAGGAIFALHPAASCVVYPICSGRETLIPSFLIISCVALWIRGTKFSHIAAIVLLPFALLSKEQAIVTPALFFMADLLRLSHDAPQRSFSRATSWCIRFAPVALIVIAYFVVRRNLFEGTSEHSFNLIAHPEGPLYSLLYAVQTIFVPFIELNYEPKLFIWLIPWRVGVAVAITLLLAWIVISALRKKDGQQKNEQQSDGNQKDSRQSDDSTAEAPPGSIASIQVVVLFWLIWIMVALAPTANILKQDANFAERYVFLAILGVIGIMGAMLGMIWNQKSQVPILVTAVVIAAVCGTISFQRGSAYQDDYAFFSQWIKSNPDSELAHVNMAEHYVMSDQAEKAWPHLNSAIKINPAAPAANNIIGYLLIEEGRIDESLIYFEIAIRAKPRYGEAHNNYARANSMLWEAAKGNPKIPPETHAKLFELAKKHYEIAIAINQNYAEPYANLGIMHSRNGEIEKAIEYYKMAIAVNATYSIPHFELGNIAFMQKRLEDAAMHYRNTLKLDPQHSLAKARLEFVLKQK